MSMISGRHRCEKMLTLYHIPHLVVCMDYWFDENHIEKVSAFNN